MDPERRQTDEQRDEAAGQPGDQQDDEHVDVVPLDDVAERDRADPDDRELPEADVSAPAGQLDERNGDDPPDAGDGEEVHRSRVELQRDVDRDEQHRPRSRRTS